MRKQDLLRRALDWYGVREGTAEHLAILKEYNSITPLPRGYRVTKSDAWCAAFVSACAHAVGIPADMWAYECSCSRQVAIWTKLGRWVEDDNHAPEIGDLVYYDWTDTGNGDNRGAPNHVGLVVEIHGDTVTVLEGNKGGAVGVRYITRGQRYIRGYAVPDWEAIEAAMPGISALVSDWARDSWAKAVAAGVLEDRDPQALVTREMLACALDKAGVI